MYLITTIITPNYLHYALALRESILQFDNEIRFCFFLTETDFQINNLIKKDYDNITILSSEDLCNDGPGKIIYDKYFDGFKDSFRWSMKPILLKHLLKYEDKIIYLDCDIHFYQSVSFLFDLLSKYLFLLSPHNRSSDAQIDELNFQKNYLEGIYNGGFIGVSKGSEHILDWWANSCIFKCIKDTANGFYVDQKYLDLIPAKFDHVYTIKHRGCNIAEWNRTECRRIEVNNQVLIDGKYPIVFMHFTFEFPLSIMYYEDKLLIPYLETYALRVKKYNSDDDILAKTIRRYEQISYKAPLLHKRIFNKIMKILKKFIHNKNIG